MLATDPLVDLHVVGILGKLQKGFSLSLLFEVDAKWTAIVRSGPIGRVYQADLDNVAVLKGAAFANAVLSLHAESWGLAWFPPLPSPFLKCDPALTRDGSGILSDPALIDEEYQKAWLPYFSARPEATLVFLILRERLKGWLYLSDEVDLPILVREMLFDVVKKKSMSAGRIDGRGWKDLKALSVSWYDDLADLWRFMEEEGCWPWGCWMLLLR